MDRKEIARETLEIMRQGYYDADDGAGGKKRIRIKDDMDWSVSHSILLTPEKDSKEVRDSGNGG